MGDAVSKRWTSLTEAKQPKFKKTSLIKAQIATLGWVFDRPLHYKVFCEEDGFQSRWYPQSQRPPPLTPQLPPSPLFIGVREKASCGDSPSSILKEPKVHSPQEAKCGFQINEESMLWKKQDIFRASRPLLLERIRRDYDAIRDPLEIHGAVVRHLIKVKEIQEENERLKSNVALATSKKRKAQDQALAEIKKHDLLHAKFTRLEGENFILQKKMTRVQLLHDQANRRASEAEQRSKAAEEALPGRIERAIDKYERSEEFRMEAGRNRLFGGTNDGYDRGRRCSFNLPNNKLHVPDGPRRSGNQGDETSFFKKEAGPKVRREHIKCNGAEAGHHAIN
ncbi:hypothetical protein LIER_19683 [Lithospermum erythrorhizon]|uniref:Uncharacterized protein n=1 Tax=Lithospermum erythrorhizon TaxID=34254 RepID=A0AAV3QJJ6_LITER